MKQQYIDLAERCEAAEAGSRELDILIAVAVKWDLEYSMAPFANLVEKFGMGWAIETASEYNSAYRSLPHYTTSLDAAMKLLPEGWQIESLSKWDAPPQEADNQSQSQSTARIVGASLERFGKKLIWGHSSKDGRAEATAKTPALALLAAICRAMGER
jgi:hypothetical protein